MFCGINAFSFPGVSGLQGLLSAAEMLQSGCPKISGAFIKYALSLIENHYSDDQPSPEVMPQYTALQQLSKSMPIASAKELESFGDSLIAAADGPTTVDFYRLAYLAYACTTLEGEIKSRVLTKFSKAEQNIACNVPPPEAMYMPPGQSQVNYPRVSAGGPPVYTPPGQQQQGPPVYTPPEQQQGPPVFTPPGQQQGPPVYTPPGQQQGPPVFTPPGQQQGPPVFTPPGGAGGPPVFSGSPSIAPPQNHQQIQQLAELARDALNSGANDVAYTAMLAAIKEIEKS